LVFFFVEKAEKKEKEGKHRHEKKVEEWCG
jgi:hypothetical protein